MKSEIITIFKSIGFVFLGVLLANAFERKYLSSKIDAPMVAPTTE
jgi:hypothetical protein